MQNIFVISQQNQVRRLIELMKSDVNFQTKYKGKTSILHLNWDNDPAIRALISDLSTICQARGFIEITVPKQANNIGSYVKRYFLKRYRNFLKLNPDLESLVVFSYAGHYSYLLQLAEKRGVELVLVEEGLGTYSGFTQEIRELPAWRVFAKAVYPLLRFRFSNLPLSFMRCINEFLPKPKQPALQSTGFRNFKIVYSRFPKAAAKLFNSAEIKFIEDRTEKKEIKTGKNSLYLGQTYPLDEHEVRRIQELLLCRGAGAVFLKHHPRISENQRKVWDLVLSDPKFSAVELVEDNLPAEDLIAKLDVGTVFSLTSSVLINTSRGNQKLKSVSLAPSLISSFVILSPTLGRIKKDLELLKTFCAEEELPVSFDY